jgi:hypothetical protein
MKISQIPTLEITPKLGALALPGKLQKRFNLVVNRYILFKFINCLPFIFLHKRINNYWIITSLCLNEKLEINYNR